MKFLSNVFVFLHLIVLIKSHDLDLRKYFQFCVSIAYIFFQILASNFPRCYRNDPDLSNCLLKATETVRPFFKAGIPKLQIPSIAPILLYEWIIEQRTEQMNYYAHLRDVDLDGFLNYKVSKIT